MPFSIERLEEIEKHLDSNPYLSEGGLPGAEDAQIYFAFSEKSIVPNVDNTPNTHYWYLFINSFSNDLMKKWIENSPKKPEKKEETKKKVEEDQGDDLFDDEPKETKPKVQPVEKPQPKKKKQVIAKSIVVFDVKVYDTQTDLDEIAKKVLALQIDGLVWNNEPKKLEVAFGIFKLQMGCVIEDDKVLTDDIFQKIQEWEEVQSVDMVSMQKL